MEKVLMSNKDELIDAPPIAINLISSLRSIGYTLESSVADLIDNSIAAKATKIDLQFNWHNGKASFYISDNGNGMSEQSLITAMTFASSNVSEDRSGYDLGRFGLGLKSASLAQCKVLTVMSKQLDKTTNLFRWDLNELENKSANGWTLIKLRDLKDIENSDLLKEKGTVVFWDEMDAIYKVGVGESEFLDLVDKVESHIAKTFHRFLEEQITLTVNGRKVLPNNPVTPQNASYISPTENVGSSSMPIELKAYGYEVSQKIKSNCGRFYIYRGSRVICSGKIKDLIQLDVRNINLTIDITNKLDFTWSIDIAKTNAQPPKEVTSRVKEFVSWVLEKVPKARKKNIRTLGSKDKDIWLTKENERLAPLLINRDHQLVKKVLGCLTSEESKYFQSLLVQLEKDVPISVEVITQQNISPKGQYSELSERGIKDIKIHLLRLTKIKKMSIEQAKEKLKKDAIFSQYSEIIDEVSDGLKEEL